MANEVAGIDVLLYIDMNTAPNPAAWTLLGGQRNVTLRQVTEVADARHKSSGAWPNRVQTFLDWSVTGDMVRISGDQTQIKLDELWRARQDVHVRVLKEDGDALQGFAVIADLSLSAPHNDVATHALDLQGNSELLPVEPS
jgi:TP901-1 family phage major tail protein